jgi:hypothetical protein
MIRLPLITVSAILALATCGKSARAQQQDDAGRAIKRDRTDTYWGVNAAALGGLVVGTLIIGAVQDDPLPPSAPTLGAAADGLFVLELTLPVPALATGNGGEKFGKAMLIYSEALAAGAATNAAARFVTGGTRASITFAAAVTSSYLFSENPDVPEPMRAAHWFVQSGLAGASALARTHATSIGGWMLVGESAAGVGLGLATYLIHEGHLNLTPTEGISAVAGLLLGLIIADSVPVDDEDTIMADPQLQLQPSAAGLPGLTVSGLW